LELVAVQVEIWSDIACPWCYIGKRRFEEALERFAHADDVTVTWRSFELDPGAPAEREGDRAEHLAAKYGTTADHARAMQDQMTDTAAGEGLEFRFDIARAGNTFDAHRLVHLGAARGVQDAVKERLLRAYLGEGELMSDGATLARLGAEAGLDPDEARDVLAGDAHAEAVRADERTAQELGISAVPFFVVDRKFGTSGAQDPELLVKLLDRAWDESHPKMTVVAGGETCGPDGC
jgi:predicted DsbA family dithiol-disulfide isomerase